MGLNELVGDDEHVVFSRNGHLIINPEGYVRSRYIDDGIGDFTGHFRYINRIDLDEWRNHWAKPIPDELDIRDVAYWYKAPDSTAGTYQSADTVWRAEVAGWNRKEPEESAP